jgi:hypothetical protein
VTTKSLPLFGIKSIIQPTSSFSTDWTMLAQWMWHHYNMQLSSRTIFCNLEAPKHSMHYTRDTFYCLTGTSRKLNILYVSIQINQPTRCNSFTSLLHDVHMWFNMFRASPRPLSGAHNCTRSLWFYHWKEAAGVLLVVVWPDHDQQRSSRFLPTVEPEAPSAVVCFWWWAGDAQNMLSHIRTSSNKLVELLHLVGWFIWIVWWCTDLQTSMLSSCQDGTIPWMFLFSGIK